MTAIDISNKRVQAVIIKGHCKLMALGMKHSSLNKTKVLKLAGEITEVKYKRGEHDKAVTDLEKWLEDNPAPSLARILADQMIDAYDMDADPIDHIFEALREDPDQDVSALMESIAMKFMFP